MADVFTAIKTGEIGRLKQYVETKQDINAKNSDGETLLYFAIKNKREKMAIYLINKNAYLNSKNGADDNTPLHAAIFFMKKYDLVKLLIDKGSDPKIKNKNGETPMFNYKIKNPFMVECLNYMLSVGSLDPYEEIKEQKEGNKEFVITILKYFNDDTNPLQLSAIEECLKNKNITKDDDLLSLLLPKMTNRLMIKTINILIKSDRVIFMTNMLETYKPDLNILYEDIKPPLFTVIDFIDIPDNIIFEYFTLLKTAGAKFNIVYYQEALIQYYINVFYNKLVHNDTHVFEYILDQDIDINYQTPQIGDTLLHLIIGFSKELILIVLNKGIDYTIKNNIGETALDYAKKKRYDTAIKTIETFIEEKEALKTPWEGQTKSDITQFDSMLENPEKWSCCPVCLSYSERIDGCRYMHHSCPDVAGRTYHTDLYNKYKTPEGNIYWCTICGRICVGHSHYEFVPADAPRANIIRPKADPFGGEENCIKDGGKGLKEKITRIMRLKEYTSELQDDIGILSFKQAKNQLIEEVWNAPYRRSRNYNKTMKSIRENRPPKWHNSLNMGRFPNVLKTRKNNNTPAPNIPKPDVNRSIVFTDGDKTNVVTMDDASPENPVIQFIHTKKDGTINEHDGEYISKSSLEVFIKNQNKEHGLPTFGYCWNQDGGCDAFLYPDDVKEYIPEEVYQEYRKKFNEKFKGRVMYGGGLKESLLIEMEDGMCYAKTPNKIGGKRYRQTRKKRSSKN